MTGDAAAAYRFVVTGRVQGVGFRQATARRAASLGLTGWVRNREDGAVEGVVGFTNPTAIEEFREWLTCGPPAARVESVAWDQTTEPAAGGFAIRP